MKKYAEFLKLDFQELQRRLNLQQDDNCTMLSREDIAQPYTTAGYKKYMWLSLILTVIGGGGYTYLRRSPSPEIAEVKIESPIAVEPIAPAAAVEPILPPEPAEPILPTEPAEIVKKPAIIVLHAVQPTWVHIRDETNQPILKRLLQTGEYYTLPSQKGLKMKVGNAAGLEITKDDAKIPSLGKAGQVIEISVDEVFPPSN